MWPNCSGHFMYTVDFSQPKALNLTPTSPSADVQLGRRGRTSTVLARRGRTSTVLGRRGRTSTVLASTQCQHHVVTVSNSAWAKKTSLPSTTSLVGPRVLFGCVGSLLELELVA
jgi:hypothetical protein